MQQKSFRVLLLLALFLLLPVFANAQWWPPKGYSDIATTGGLSNTLIVQIVNATPYNIYFKEGSFSVQYAHAGLSTNLRDEFGSTAMNPDSKKGFMFAPLGVPQNIEPVPPAAFQDPNYVNTTTYPYSFVISWDDRAAYNEYNWLTWTIKNVPCTDTAHCSAPQKDVDLGFFVRRASDDPALKSGYYWDLGKQILKDVLGIIAVVVMPENPLAWGHLTLLMGETSKDAFGAVQNTDDGTNKWHVAAYPFPAAGSDCARLVTTNPDTNACYPSAEQDDDGVKAEWAGQTGGWAEQNIVVAVELRRPVAPFPEYLCVDWYPGWVGSLGTVPVAVVTIMTVEEWQLATSQQAVRAMATGAPGPTGKPAPNSAEVTNAAQMIHSTLQQTGRPGLLTLFSIIRGLNNQQRQVLRELYANWRAGNALTPNQQTFLHMLAVQLRNQVNQGKAR